ncbi:serine/threonine protein kinase [Labilithrix luteola]|uniref:Serine/threonine protein kinase n=1 Tax=Labilithrix luteola TaxID=1391654 RepID=A0A0K1QB62_9BACT|nr:serine/threonine-protein kinase [Labilithrix luteola]AKV02650.1 serine/threonine protein kinase [Labilithrix luteola]
MQSAPQTLERLGRYAIFDRIASGGMATVYFGRLLGVGGFSRTVAIKRLHPHLAQDPNFAAMLLDEARLVGRIRHPNVVQTLDVEQLDGELFIVMEYVHGESLARLMQAMRRDEDRIPLRITAAVLCAVLHGLHAAHEVKNETGESLDLVHRDVSPHNILVGSDGIARVLDFGVAKARDRVQTTRDGKVKGKIAYMPIEQFEGEKVDRRADIYSAGVVLWEALTGDQLFGGDTEAVTLMRMVSGVIPPPSSVVSSIPTELEEVVLKALSRDPAKRFDTARQMALAIERCVPLATAAEIGEWVEMTCGGELQERAEAVRRIEACSLAGEIRPTSKHGPSTEPASPAASVTPAVSEVRPTPRRRPWLGGALLGVGICAGAISAALFVPRPAPVAKAPVEQAPVSSVPMSASPSPTPSPSAHEQAAATTTTLTSSAPASSPITASSVASARMPSATRAKRAPASKPASQCDPPYTVDAQGVRHYKPQCSLE